MDDEYWSLTWQPTAHAHDSYECRVGLGYQTIKMRYREVASEVTYFVPIDGDLEIWLVTVKNESLDPKRLSVIPYVELCLGHALVDLINQPNDQHFNRAHFDREDNAIYATKNYWVVGRGVSVAQPNAAWDRYVVFTTDLAVESWDCGKDAFIGPWRSEQNPIGIENGVLSETDITSGDARAALQSEVVIEGGQAVGFVVLMGCVDARRYHEESIDLIRRYRSPESAMAELDRLKAYWEEYLSSVQVATPDRRMNWIVNVWGKRQSWVTFNANRNAGYYHGGLLFGVGMRDQCQDMWGPLLADPRAVEDRLAEVMTHQFQDGSTPHNYFKLTGVGEKTGHSDTPLWIPLALINYLKETGDLAFLTRAIDFQDGGQADALDHALRSVDYVLSQLTENHLPKFGPGDWNDTLDYVGRKGKGESVWVADFLCYIVKDIALMLDNACRRGPVPR